MAIKSVYDRAFTLKGWFGTAQELETWFDHEWVTLVTSGQTVAVNQATETDLAQSIAWAPKARLVNQTTETDLAQPVARVKTKAVGQVTETDLAQAIAKTKLKAVGQATEPDLSQAIAKRKTKAVGQAVETDLAQPIGKLKAKLVGQVVETDLSQPIAWAPKARLVHQAVETDLAQPLTRAAGQTVTVNQASETDLAQPLTHAKLKALSQVVETDLAQALARSKSKLIGDFPVTPVLDTFNRANENPLASPWAKLSNVHSNTQLLSNYAQGQLFVRSSRYLSSVTTTPDLELYAKVVTRPSTNEWVELFGRVANPNTNSLEAYCVQFIRSATANKCTVKLIKFVANAEATLLTFTDAVTWANGDFVGVRMVGSTISAWFKPAAGSWSRLALVVDTTITAGGYLGIGVLDSVGGAGLDDLGGGDITLYATDLAQAVAWAPKNRFVGQALETDLAQLVTVISSAAQVSATYIPTYRPRRGR